MAGDFIFLSYPHSHRDDATRLVEFIEAQGLKVWFSGHMMPGRYEPQIRQRVEAATGMIALLPREAVDPARSNWILTEIQWYRDTGKDLLLPCIIGDYQMSGELTSAVSAWHQVYADGIAALPGSDEFCRRWPGRAARPGRNRRRLRSKSARRRGMPRSRMHPPRRARLRRRSWNIARPMPCSMPRPTWKASSSA